MKRAVVVKNSDVEGAGRGLFAAEDLPAGVCVGEYGGVLKRFDEIMPASSFDERGCVLDTKTFGKKMIFLKTFPFGEISEDESPLDCFAKDSGEIVIDPTDDKGDLIPEFSERFAGLFANEPPPGVSLNAVFAFCPRRKAIEIWTLSRVERGQELFVFYGAGYDRPYLISEDLCDLNNISFILSSSSLRSSPQPSRCPGSCSRSSSCCVENEVDEDDVCVDPQSSIAWISLDQHFFSSKPPFPSFSDPSLDLATFLQTSSSLSFLLPLLLSLFSDE